MGFKIARKMLANRRGHADPFCLSFPIVATILSIVFIFFVEKPGRVSPFEQYLIVAFVFIFFSGVVVRIIRHGFTPWSAIPILVLLISSLFMLRFVFGVPSPYDAFLVRNAIYIMPTLTVFLWTMTHLP